MLDWDEILGNLGRISSWIRGKLEVANTCFQTTKALRGSLQWISKDEHVLK